AGRLPHHARAGKGRSARVRDHAARGGVERGRYAYRAGNALPVDPAHGRRRVDRRARHLTRRRTRGRSAALLPTHPERPRGGAGRSEATGDARRARSHPETTRPIAQARGKKMSSRVPEDFHTITPHIVVRGVARAIEWYTSVFGAHELLRHAAPGDGGAIMHSELLLGDSRFFVVDEFPQAPWSPQTLGGTSVTLHLYVED